MKLRSFAVVGVFGVMAAACGSGSGASLGSPIGNNAVPNSGNQPPNNSSVPSNPNQPPNSSSTPGAVGGTLCASLCALAAKYSCLTLTLPRAIA